MRAQAQFCCSISIYREKEKVHPILFKVVFVTVFFSFPTEKMNGFKIDAMSQVNADFKARVLLCRLFREETCRVW